MCRLDFSVVHQREGELDSSSSIAEVHCFEPSNDGLLFSLFPDTIAAKDEDWGLPASGAVAKRLPRREPTTRFLFPKSSGPELYVDWLEPSSIWGSPSGRRLFGLSLLVSNELHT